jgi:beta-glucanase (GH16 family)
VRIGVKAHNDPRLRNDMDEVALELDATDWHTYGGEWTPERIRFFVDDRSSASWTSESTTRCR